MITQTTTKVVARRFDLPDVTRYFGNGQVDLVHAGPNVVGMITLRPGWRWSRDVKPIVGTLACQEAHTQYAISGRLLVAMDDGAQTEIKAGDVAFIPPGHDAWVLGDEPFVAIDFTGSEDYARSHRDERR